MKHTSKRGWIVWAVAALFYLYEMILRVSPSVMTHQLMETFSVSSTMLGVLVSFYYYSYNALQIPCGIIVDKFGPRAIITVSSLMCTAGAFLFCFSDSLILAQFSRFIMGAGSACAFLSTLKLTATWFVPAQFALVTGLTVMMGKLGGASQSLMSRGVAANGWQTTVFTLGVIGIVVTILCWFLIKDKPDEVEKSVSVDDIPQEKFDLKTVLRNKSVWIVGVVGGLMYIPITGFAELWAVPYMMTVCDIDNRLASDISALLYFGFALGSPLFAVISRKLNCHLSAMKLSSLCAMFIFGYICFFPEQITLNGMRALFFIGGMSMAGQVLCFSVAKEHTDISVGGTTIGFTNTLVMFSGLIFQPLIGKILDWGWEGTLSETGIRIYSKAAYQTAAIAIPVGMFLCLFLLQLLKNRKTAAAAAGL
jgi:sugar phosphate permease